MAPMNSIGGGTSMCRIVVAILLVTFCITPTFSDQPSDVSHAIAGSQSLKRDELMPLAFPNWKRGPERAGLALPPTEVVEIGIPKWPTKTPWLPTPGDEPKPESESSTVLAEPVAVIRMDPNHGVMVATIQQVQGNQTSCGYGCPTLVGAYFFEQRETVWVLTKRVDAAAYVEYGPQDVKVEKWTGHGFILTFGDGGCWQGACSTTLVMLGLQPDRVIPLLSTSFSVSTVGVTASEDVNPNDVENFVTCGDVLNPTHPLPKNFKLGTDECKEVQGHWQLEGDRVRFDFSGKSRQNDANGDVAPLKEWTSTAILEWTGSSLRLVEGELPSLGV